jgi:hypothetical protein
MLFVTSANLRCVRDLQCRVISTAMGWPGFSGGTNGAMVRRRDLARRKNF